MGKSAHGQTQGWAGSQGMAKRPEMIAVGCLTMFCPSVSARISAQLRRSEYKLSESRVVSAEILFC